MTNELERRAREYDAPERARAAGVYPYYRALERSDGPEVTLGGRSVLMFGSNDYLGLGAHPQVKAAARAAIDQFGTGLGGSRLLNGSLDLHAQLEARLARFLDVEDVVVFATGYQANVGALSALLGRHDVVLHDEENHASLIDGVRLSFARSSKFAHNDPAALARVLGECVVPEGGTRLVVVESVYSMSGDVAPLDELSRVCREAGAVLMVDEAHGIGVLGARGEGAGCAGATLVMGTFSKSLGSVGGFIGASRAICSLLRHKARALVFSAALSPPNAAAALCALDLLEREPERLTQLRDNARFARHALAEVGYDVSPGSMPIVPLPMPSAEAAFAATTALLEQGVFVNPIVPPAVSHGARLRFTVTAAHDKAQIAAAVTALAKVRACG